MEKEKTCVKALQRTCPCCLGHYHHGHGLSRTLSTPGCVMQAKAVCSRRGDWEGYWLVGAFSFARLLLSLAAGIWATHLLHPELSLAPWSLVRLSHPSITYRMCISMHGQKSRSLNIDFVYVQQESHVPLLFHLNCAKRNQKKALKVDAFPKNNDGWSLLKISKTRVSLWLVNTMSGVTQSFLRLLQHYFTWSN